MPSSEDLNTNLIKSLTSVHLPPPPSSHQQPQSPVFFANPPHTQNQIYTPGHQQDQHTRYSTNRPMAKPMLGNHSKRLSATLEELSQPLPLTTPPHTITRGETTARSKKSSKTQETPTLPQGRGKRPSKDPLSPQYSSPSSAANECERVVKKALKPPQPSFVSTKPSKKQSQREQRQRQHQQEMEIQELPSPGRMPRIVYESTQKPPYSYATLIGMAILRGDERKLTLSQIYHWISSTFSYYRMEDVGWQNSIRHNLSLNKAFIKTEKSSDGKGHYWEVAKGHEMQFLKAKNGKRAFGGIQLEQGKREEPRLIKPAPVEPMIIKKALTESGTSEDEFSDGEHMGNENTKTPKAQIRSTDPQFNYQRLQLKKSNSAIGLQRFSVPKISYDDISDDEGEEDAKVPTKRRQLKSMNTGSGTLRDIPQLEAPDTNWAASTLGDRIIFGQVRPDSPRDHLANIPLTSSFSCNTNFDFSPLKRQETGPLLEPLTPGSRLTSFSTNLTVPSSQTTVRTPLRNTTTGSQPMSNSLLSAAHNSYLHQLLRTPTAKIRTPNSNTNTNTNSIIRKFWHSPSAMDDFYTSPSIPRNSDDSYHDGLYGSPERHSRKQLFQESSGNYDLFGVDICSVVKRAVESCNDTRLGALIEREGSSTEEDDH